MTTSPVSSIVLISSSNFKNVSRLLISYVTQFISTFKYQYWSAAHCSNVHDWRKCCPRAILPKFLCTHCALLPLQYFLQYSFIQCTLRTFIQLKTKRGLAGLALPYWQAKKIRIFYAMFCGVPWLQTKDNHVFVVFGSLSYNRIEQI